MIHLKLSKIQSSNKKIHFKKCFEDNNPTFLGSFYFENNNPTFVNKCVYMCAMPFLYPISIKDQNHFCIPNGAYK